MSGFGEAEVDRERVVDRDERMSPRRYSLVSVGRTAADGGFLRRVIVALEEVELPSLELFEEIARVRPPGDVVLRESPASAERISAGELGAQDITGDRGNRT